MVTKFSLNRAIVYGVVLILSLVLVNLVCVYTLEEIWLLNIGEKKYLNHLATACGLLIQLAALILGGLYFIKNLSHDREKENRSKRNELIKSLIAEFKSAKIQADQLFTQSFADGQEFKNAKDSITDSFSMISTLIENSEKIFSLKDVDYGNLMSPSSTMQNSKIFAATDLDKLKIVDRSIVRSNFNSSLNSALSTCWSSLQ